MGDTNVEPSHRKRCSNETIEKPEATAVSEDTVSAKKEEPVAATKSTYIERDVVEDEVLYKSLHKMSFYHGFLPREDLGVILRNEGDYLIRVSEVATKKKEGGVTPGIKRDIILSLCTSDRGATESEHKDAKSENNLGERKMRNMVIRRYEGLFGIKSGSAFATIEALLANYHVSNASETKENRILKTPIDLQYWESRHSAVKLGEKLGEGAYGEVRKGMLLRKGRQQEVAVKLMKGSGDMNKVKIREMMKEARLMRNFKHKNVVRFYGVAVVEQPLYILLELVNGGALNTYLQKNKNVSMFELMSMCLGAAQGLQYLHANHCIHRDIAARNCLYSIDKVVKLSDFGLSLISNAYKLCSSQKLPIKWLAPETITTLYFTPKTDVYSYGVMCYEIFSDGEEPWDNITNTEAKRNVVTAKHLEIPYSCPEKFRSFVHEKIFVVDPKRRVVMDDVVRFIEPIINDMHNAAANVIINTAAERSERGARGPSDNLRSVMMPVIPSIPPRNHSNSSRKSKSKIKQRKVTSAPVKQTAVTPRTTKKTAHPGNHNMVEK